MKYNYNYSVETSGVYGKFGIILTPGAGLRLGAAIQTPTATTVMEEWRHSGETHFTDSGYSASESSPYGEDRYRFREPWRANFGLAWTLGGFAVISADYEICDYSRMQFRRNRFDDGREYFDELNSDIKTIYGKSNMLRLGAEIKLGTVAVRGGYGLTTSPEKASLSGEKLPGLKTQTASFGLGYASKKSFFADAAVRYAFATDEYFMPYDDYMYDNNGDLVAFAPEILNTRSDWKVLLTIGWRF
jgi:long-subunit fatty acid transport protein